MPAWGASHSGQAGILTGQAFPCSVPALIRALCLGTHWRGPPGAAGSWPLLGLIQFLETSLWGTFSLKYCLSRCSTNTSLPFLPHWDHLPAAVHQISSSCGPLWLNQGFSCFRLQDNHLLDLFSPRLSGPGPTVSAGWVWELAPKC